MRIRWENLDSDQSLASMGINDNGKWENIQFYNRFTCIPTGKEMFPRKGYMRLSNQVLKPDVSPNLTKK